MGGGQTTDGRQSRERGREEKDGDENRETGWIGAMREGKRRYRREGGEEMDGLRGGTHLASGDEDGYGLALEPGRRVDERRGRHGG